MSQHNKPLAGIKVVEFTHMVMGPTAGVILGDLGADVIKIEPLQGDNTRNLKGSGGGYFAMYNRNKSSLCIDLKNEEGIATAKEIIARSDIMIENFRPGAMEKLGLGYDTLSQSQPGLIYCSLKGFLSGPYEHRTALDESTSASLSVDPNRHRVLGRSMNPVPFTVATTPPKLLPAEGLTLINSIVPKYAKPTPSSPAPSILLVPLISHTGTTPPLDPTASRLAAGLGHSTRVLLTCHARVLGSELPNAHSYVAGRRCSPTTLTTVPPRVGPLDGCTPTSEPPSSYTYNTPDCDVNTAPSLDTSTAAPCSRLPRTDGE